MKNNTELKPCPFCGGKADIHQAYDSSYCVQCNVCGATTLYNSKKFVVIRKWNRRTVE